MGSTVYTRSLYKSAIASEGVTERAVTARAEKQAKATGKLDPLVDPAGYGVIRRSMPRVEELVDGTFRMTVGTPIPIENRIDTTGSMGGNVDVAMKVLPDLCESLGKVLEGYDIHIATGIFGDVQDAFPLCRPQFEMHVDKIVKQLTLMVPLKDGGDTPEDPDIGIFGGAYLVRSYLNRIGLKGYDFTVTDAPGRGQIDEAQLRRVYGEEVFDKVKENGHRLNIQNGIELSDVWNALLDRAHAFVLQVGESRETTRFWNQHIDKNRLVKLPDTKCIPQVEAVIIGLTEGTLSLTDVPDFLSSTNIDKSFIKQIAESVVNIPIGAQRKLPKYDKRPMKGDLFKAKPDIWTDENLWPFTSDEKKPAKKAKKTDDSGDNEKDSWL